MYLYNEFLMNFYNDINTLSWPIIFKNTIELTMHTSCYCLELTYSVLLGLTFAKQNLSTLDSLSFKIIGQ